MTTVVLTILCGALLYVMAYKKNIKTGDQLLFANPIRTSMDDYFIVKGQEKTGSNNIVTSIVFDFRGFDTLGEATVLFVTVLGIGMLVRKSIFNRTKDDNV